MLHVALQERASRLGRRMEELDCSMGGVTVRSVAIATVHLFCLYQMLVVARPRYMTCGFAWMPLSLSFVIFAVHCFYFSSDLRRLWRYSAERESVRAKLNAARRMLLEHGDNHEASLAEVEFHSTTLTWMFLVCFAVKSALLTCVTISYAIFTCAA